MTARRVGVGVIGAGTISAEYLRNLTRFPDLDVRFVADLELERAARQAEAFAVPRSGPVEDLLADEEVEIVVNLTIPAAHFDVSHRSLAAGKHVWSEKPLALDRASAAALLAEARAAGLRVGCAPDTILGAGLQTALRAIRRGDIGEPLTATTMFHVPGPDRWHPSPEFLFAEGAGPLFDIGPYYLTTLVHALGPATRVHAVASTARRTRTIGAGPRAGQEFPVLVPTHHAALIEFAGGRSAQSTFSFEHALSRSGMVEINGTTGTLVLPDPNRFDGASSLWRYGGDEPSVLVATGVTATRGTGVADLARAIRGGPPEHAPAAVAAHVLDILLSIRDAAASGEPVDVGSTVAVPELLPEDWDPAGAALTP